jgi:hypothetical protein
MHFELFIEDFSGKKALDILVPKIISPTKNTFKTYPYKGIGKIPNDLHRSPDPNKKLLLNKLPAILKAYGKWSISDDLTVIVVVDCDTRDCMTFKQELTNVLGSCNPRPAAFFRIAIEEIEAWLLGDKTAIEKAYPKMNQREYAEYRQDSANGTWEKLADITLSREAAKYLKKATFFEIGKQKIEWAQRIGACMDINNNASPSFNCFKKKLEELAQ